MVASPAPGPSPTPGQSTHHALRGGPRVPRRSRATQLAQARAQRPSPQGPAPASDGRGVVIEGLEDPEAPARSEGVALQEHPGALPRVAPSRVTQRAVTRKSAPIHPGSRLSLFDQLPDREHPASEAHRIRSLPAPLAISSIVSTSPQPSDRASRAVM